MAEQRPSTVRHRAALFRDATEIVDAEFASELALDEVARRIATSRRQQQRAFAEVGGTSFRDHVTDVRMAKAAAMLTSSQLTVGKVSRAVGYRQQAQFAKAFRRRYGVAPGVYRRSPDGHGPLVDGRAPMVDGYAPTVDGHASSAVDRHRPPSVLDGR